MRAPRAHAGTNAAAANTPDGFLLTAGQFDAADLNYVGTFTVSRPSGDVDILRFVVTSGSIADLSVTQGCTSGVTTVLAANSVTLGPTTFDAISLAATIGGVPQTFTTNDPPAAPFPTDLHLADVTVIGTRFGADTLSTSSYTTHSATC